MAHETKAYQFVPSPKVVSATDKKLLSKAYKKLAKLQD
jgi:hypothetical protein